MPSPERPTPNTIERTSIPKDLFDKFTQRLATTTRVANDLGNKIPARMAEVAELEKRPVEKNTFEKIWLDARGYKAVYTEKEWVAPDGRTMRERRVMFTKPDAKGQPTYLKEGAYREGVAELNAHLYDARIPSPTEKGGAGFKVTIVPIIGGDGKNEGIVEITEGTP